MNLRKLVNDADSLAAGAGARDAILLRVGERRELAPPQETLEARASLLRWAVARTRGAPVEAIDRTSGAVSKRNARD